MTAKEEEVDKKEMKAWKCAHCSNDLPSNAQKCGFCGYKICNSCDASNCPKK